MYIITTCDHYLKLHHGLVGIQKHEIWLKPAPFSYRQQGPWQQYQKGCLF